MKKDKIPFNKPYMTGKEIENISKAHENGILSGDGPFTKKCHEWFKLNSSVLKAFLTHSCTAALEMSAILANIEPGDEVIMPSYTFVSTANAFVLRGGVPVFVDIRSDTLNIDESLIVEAITPRTKAITPVHYAGVSSEMGSIMETAKKYNLLVIEDAAQGFMSRYKGRPLGSIGDLGAYSFHETKNIISGEGGALLVNNDKFSRRAEVIREKGTNRSQFLQGLVDKYTWVDIGSSFLPGEIIAAFLYAQMQEAKTITENRLNIWAKYHEGFLSAEKAGKVRRPIIPNSCQHNAHMYYLLLESNSIRNEVLASLNSQGINAVFHYVPLHKSPVGERLCKVSGNMKNTEELSGRLIRLPLWMGIDKHLDMIIEEVYKALK